MATDPQTLLGQSNCYACFGTAGTWRLLEISLLAQWAAQQSGPALDPVVSAWVARVQANGGGTPSLVSQNAINTFWLAMKAAGIDGKFIHLNCIAGDNYITATTPLIVGPGGLNAWGDPSGQLHGQQVDLAQGLNGDPNYTLGAGFDTGVIPSNTSLGNGVLDNGITVYVSVQEPDGTNHTHGGCDDYGVLQTNQFKLIYDFLYVAYNNENPPDGATGATGGGIYAPFSGFISMNSIPAPAWVIAVYGFTNNVPQFPVLTALSDDSGYGGTTPFGIPVHSRTFYWLESNGSFQEPSAETISFAAFHHGLTFAQCQTLFNAVQAMRIAMGGGYV